MFSNNLNEMLLLQALSYVYLKCNSNSELLHGYKGHADQMSRSFQHAEHVAMKSAIASAFVPANTIGNKNKTQANRTQTAAAVTAG